MKFSLFLGAGASVPLGFPDTAQFKTNLEGSIAQGQDPDNKLLSMLQKSGYEDIENILTAIEALVVLPSNPGYNLLNRTINLTYRDVEDDPISKSFDEIMTDFSEYKEKIQNYVYKAYSWNRILNSNLRLYDNIFKILRNSDDGIHICTTNYDQVMEH